MAKEDNRRMNKMQGTYLLLVASFGLMAASTFGQGTLTLRLSGTVAQVSGTVRDDAGIPVPGAQVLVGRTFPISGIAGREPSIR